MDELAIRPVKVAVDGGGEGGLLIFHGGMLVAVLACLTADIYDEDRGWWHLEAGFGHCAARPATFADLEQALRWVAGRLELDADRAIAPALASYQDINSR